MKQSILVGDIGSSKSSWWHDGDGSPQELHFHGFHPLAHPEDRGKELFESLKRTTGSIAFSDIWYYGAGVIDEVTAEQIRLNLKHAFPKSEIHVFSDLAGACFAASGDHPGIVAILGTGSHAAVWNGRSILRQATSLGYILGDEAGGCDIGKALIQAYFYKEMPIQLTTAMEERLPEGRAGFLAALHSSPAPNQYLADFARVAVRFHDDPWITDLVASRFQLFIHRHILPLLPDSEIHIVGSIGCIFASLISNELDKAGLRSGTFIKDPALKLFERHLKYGTKEN